MIALSTACAAQQQITVEEVVAAAIQRNFDVRLQQNIAASASTAEKNSIGVFLPNINAVGSRVFNNNNQRQILADNTEVQRNGVRSNNLTSSLQLSWTLFDGATMFATRSRLEEISAQGEILVKSQMTNTIADVINNYYDVVRQKQQLKAINEQLSVGEERVKLAERKLEVGIGAKPELLQAKVDLNAFKTAALQQEAFIIQSKDQLNGLAAMGLPEGYDVSDTIPINLEMTLEEVVTGLENTNPELLAARKNIEIARFALKERRGERYPTINFNANYNFSRQKNALVINNFTTLFNQNLGFNYGVSANLPILNGLFITNGIQQASIFIDRQKLIYDQLKVNAMVGVRIAFASYDNARKTLIIEEENINFARENVTIMLESFKRGVATFIELRTAQQSFADAYYRLIAARYNAKVSETELLRLKGALIR
jgi:outer membrane protein TolC